MKEEEKLDKELLFAFLDEYGFRPKSGNKNIHIQVRNSQFNCDIWPTTKKMWVTIHEVPHISEEKGETYLGIFPIMKKLFELSYLLPEE